jgi:beta-N-acetylhexosaminidase
MADEEGGGVQRLAGAVPAVPWARDLARSFTPAQVQALAAQLGRAMQQLGVSVDLAPVLDADGGAGPSATDPDGSRSFSPDPEVVTRYGLAFLRGLRAGRVTPVVKHFPGLGGASGNTDVGPAATLPIATLRSGGLRPFQAAIADGVPAVMISNATVPGLTTLPASLSSSAIDGLLRHDLGFGGLVLTDSLSAGAIAQAGFSLPAAATAAIEAGADMVLFGSTLTAAQTQLLTPANVARSVNQIVDGIVAAEQSGVLPVQRLDEAVGHVLAVKGVDLCPR